MSYDNEKDGAEAPELPQKIRITLTGTKVKVMERLSNDVIDRAKANNLPVNGPVRIPTKVLKITTRKTPNGEGSKTWDSYEMRIHKRIIDIVSPTELVKKLIAINVETGVDVDVTVAA